MTLQNQAKYMGLHDDDDTCRVCLKHSAGARLQCLANPVTNGSATCHLRAVCHMAYSFREICSLGKDLLYMYPYLVSTAGVQFYFEKCVWYFKLVHDASFSPITMLQTKTTQVHTCGC
jgi:hypothetical protein